mgnify:CR=1 FL=1
MSVTDTRPGAQLVTYLTIPKVNLGATRIQMSYRNKIIMPRSLFFFGELLHFKNKVDLNGHSTIKVFNTMSFLFAQWPS